MSKRCFMSWQVKMVLELKTIKEGVESRIGLPILKKIMKEMELSPDALWAMKCPQTFVLGLIMVTLYKGMMSTSYLSLQKEVTGWARMSNDGIQHNVKKYQVALQKWAKKVLTPQTPIKLS